MPSAIRSNGLTRSADSSNQNAPSVTWHLAVNAPCANAYNPNIFTILEISYCELQFSVLEELHITKYQPTQCKQKGFYDLLLFNSTDYISTKPD